jgi:carbonic anhydrase
VSATDDLLQRAESYAKRFDKGGLPMQPTSHVAVVACMDARLNPYGILGLSEGEAHVIRNAGGLVTQDVVRSLAISQRLLGTREVILVHHADCGMRTFKDEEFNRQVQAEVGMAPPWASQHFPPSTEDVRQSLARLRESPFLAHRDSLRGFIYDEKTGRLTEVR